MILRTLLPSLALVILPLAANAQQVQKCCGTSNSTFLLGNTTFAKHTQSLYLPSDLSNAQSGAITHLYFRYGSTGVDMGNTLGGLVIRLGQTTATSFMNGSTFFTGLGAVLQVPELIIAPGIQGDWFSIALQTPFNYQVGQTLIVDIWFETSLTGNFGTLGTTNNGRKLYANDLVATTGSTTSSTWQDIGFDVQGPTGMDQVAITNPIMRTSTGGQLEFVWPAPQKAVTNVHVLDATGRTVFTDQFAEGRTSYALDLGGEATGIYFIRLHANGEKGHTVRYAKP